MPGRRRLFVAVWPPAELVETLAGLERPQAKGLRWTTRDQWHVTLRFLGSVEEYEFEALAGALGGVAGELQSGRAERPLTAVGGPGPRAFGRGVWVLPVAGLEGLAGVVEGLVGAAGDAGPAGGAGSLPAGDAGPAVEGRPRPFHGHLTLARAKHPSLLRGLPRPAISCSWEVCEVTLVNSTLHPQGARYEVLERWRL
ncbi:MAG TPA: 2'-5' RNA ligase family protein [Acidimicrobiales bacterium]|nr:2'-5' RNA ligase family protein [Acidimicrobiales bacterium]